MNTFIIMRYLNLVYIVIIALFVSNCLEEIPVEQVDFQIQPSVEILHHLESQGDYINSELTPTVMNATDVFENINEYLILDIRRSENYIKGYIENSINIPPQELLDYFLESVGRRIIIIVDDEGQESGYYTCLLRLLGYDNVYSLNFGMASWHIDFALNMLRGIEDSKPPINFTDIHYPKFALSNLPNIGFKNSAKTMQEKLLSRISLVWNSYSLIDNLPRVDEDNYLQELETKYFICYGDQALYLPDEVNGSHQIGVTNYRHHYYYDLRSTNYLQTLPADKTIYIYSYHGQLSAYIAAYLHVLGFNVKSLKYGGMSYPFIRAELLSHSDPRVLDISKVMNLPYIK